MISLVSMMCQLLVACAASVPAGSVGGLTTYRAIVERMRPTQLVEFETDTLDSMPGWQWERLVHDVVMHERWPGWNIFRSSQRDSLERGLGMINPFNGQHFFPQQQTYNEHVVLLAFSELEITWSVTYGSNPEVHTNTLPFQQGLVGVEALDTANRRIWGVGWVQGRYDTLSLRPQTGVDWFDHRPTNADIRQWLLEYDHRPHAGADVVPYFFDPEHYHVADSARFISGMVRANAWRQFTGEAPTLFFPNGK